MPVVALGAVVHLGVTLAHAWGLYQAGKTAFNWAQAQDQLIDAENQLEQLKSLRPAELGHPEWARDDGYFDQRRKPFPALREEVKKAREAAQKRNEEAFLLAIKKIATMGAHL